MAFRERQQRVTVILILPAPRLKLSLKLSLKLRESIEDLYDFLLHAQWWHRNRDSCQAFCRDINHFSPDSQSFLLREETRCAKPVRQKSGVQPIPWLDNRSMPSRDDLAISEPRNSLANILHVFTGIGYYQIAWVYLGQIFCLFF